MIYNIEYFEEFIIKYRELTDDKTKRKDVLKEYLKTLEHTFKYLDDRSVLAASSSISAWFGEGFEINSLWEWLKEWLIYIKDDKKRAAIAVGCTDLISEPPVNAIMLQNLFSLLSEPKAHWVILSAYELRTNSFYDHFDFFVKFKKTDELQNVLKGFEMGDIGGDGHRHSQ